MGIMSAVRNMACDSMPTVNLGYVRYGRLEYKSDEIDKVSNSLAKGFSEFAPIYDECVSRDSYTPERVFHNAVLSNFSSMEKISGVDIIYDDITLHMRIVINGEDRVQHDGFLESSNHITNCNGSTVVIRFEKFRTNNHNEYWEYFVTM